MNRIFLGISVVINLVLIATVVGILPFLLTSCIIIIILLCWYIKKLTTQLTEVSDDFNEFYLKLEQYEKHISEIHGMEMFYGDQTLQSLINHSRGLLNEIYDFQGKFFTPEEEELDDDNDPEEKESILYRSAPRSDS